MSYNLFCDDCRTPLENYEQLPWVIARNYKEFVTVLKERGLPEYTSLDHDLSRQAALLYYEMKEKRETEIDYSRLTDRTGLDCLIKLMVTHIIGNFEDKPLKVNIHSHNRFGVLSMKALMKKTMSDDEYELTTFGHAFKLEGHLMPLRNDNDKN